MKKFLLCFIIAITFFNNSRVFASDNNDDYEIPSLGGALMDVVIDEIKDIVINAVIDYAKNEIIEWWNSNPNTNALFKAVKKFETTPDEILTLVKKGAEINAKDKKSGFTPLILAVINSNLNVIETLIECGAEVNTTEKNGFTPLILAAGSDFEAVKILIQSGADVNFRDNIGATALMYSSAYTKNSSIIKMLIQSGADVNAKNNYGTTALMYAAEKNKVPEIIETLLRSGASVNSKNDDGESALMLACRYASDLQIIETLINNGAIIDDDVWDNVRLNENSSIRKKIEEFLLKHSDYWETFWHRYSNDILRYCLLIAIIIRLCDFFMRLILLRKLSEASNTYAVLVLIVIAITFFVAYMDAGFIAAWIVATIAGLILTAGKKEFS